MTDVTGRARKQGAIQWRMTAQFLKSTEKFCNHVVRKRGDKRYGGNQTVRKSDGKKH
jgi:hypothetical protein